VKRSLASAFLGVAAITLSAAPPRASADPTVTSANGQVTELTCQSGVALFNPVAIKRDDHSGTTPSNIASYDQSVSSYSEDPGGQSRTCTAPDPNAPLLVGRMQAGSSANQKSTVSADADTVVVESSGSAAAGKTDVPKNCFFEPFASASTSFKVRITITRRCSYQFTGSFSGRADDGDVLAVTSFGLSGPAVGGGPEGVPNTFAGNGADAPSSSISKSGVFEPGEIELDVTAVCDLGGIDSTGGLHGSPGSQARATWVVSFSLSPVQNGDDIRWTKRSGGAFGTDANWNPAQVPLKDATHADNAIFGLPGRYAVDFASSKRAAKALGPPQTSDRLEILSGDVTLENANLKVDELDLARPSLRVDVGKLTLASGQLTSNSATIGDLHSVGAEIDVVGAASTWNCLGRLRVAGSDGSGGEGRLMISGGAAMTSAETRIGAGGAQTGFAKTDGTGSSWDTGNVAVGFSSEGHFVVTGGAQVSSGVIVIGLADGDSPSAAGVGGIDAAGTSSQWDGSSLRLGPTFGILAVIDGGRMNVSEVSIDAGAILVSDVEAAHARPSQFGCNSLTIGQGNFTVRSGAQAFVVLGETRVGVGGATGPGSLEVNGTDPATGDASSFETDGLFSVGALDGGVGAVEVTAGGKLICSADADVGTAAESAGVVLVSGGSTWQVQRNLHIGDEGGGVVVLDSSTLSVSGDTVVSPNGTLQGSGTLMDGGDVVEDGFISPTIQFMQPVAPSTPKRRSSSRAKSAAPTAGRLTIQGNLVVGPTGVITAEAAGATPDQVVVTGDATLDGTLVLQFKNGFAPKTGNQFEILHVNGATTGAFASVETRGLAPGAQFSMATSDGAFTLTSTNDAVALPTVFVKASTKKLFERRPKKKATLTFTRKGATNAALTVSYTLGGTATNGFDYVSLPGVVTIPAKKRSAKVVVQVVNDPFHELAETIDVAVVPGADYTQSLSSTARITIVDND
jgi:T5SS/PEP-CTERM-associated repeat protein